MNKELQRIWKEVPMGYLRVLSLHLPRGGEENHEKPARIVFVMWYNVVWQEYTDTSKEYTASIFRVKSKLRLMWEERYQGMEILMRMSVNVTAVWDDREECVCSYQLPSQSGMFLHTKRKWQEISFVMMLVHVTAKTALSTCLLSPATVTSPQ